MRFCRQIVNVVGVCPKPKTTIMTQPVKILAGQVPVPRPVPRLGTSFPFEIITTVVTNSFKSLGYAAPTTDQRKVLMKFIKGSDVFVSLATGGGKSLCYATLRLIFDALRAITMKNAPQEASGTARSVVFVVSPLLALMADQVETFTGKGLKCIYLHKNVSTEMKSEILAGNFQLIYLSPERLVQDLEILEMFRSPIYVQSLVAFVVDEAHCIDTW